MKALNLFTLCNAIGNANFDLYEKQLSHREEIIKHKDYELDTLAKLTNKLLQNPSRIRALDGFFFSYTINQIGKEFDLIKFDKNVGILNIELKSQDIGDEKILKQLLRNKYYLEAVSNNVFLYTYVADIDTLYKLSTDDTLIGVAFTELQKINGEMEHYCESGIDELFQVSNYLISPLNTPEKFLAGSCFLTQNQEDIKRNIDSKILDGTRLFGITGDAGTGKTLVLYDIAKQYASRNKKVCVIHCGIKCEGHCVINDAIDNLTIFEAKDIGRVDLSGYEVILIDEAQRIYTSDLNAIIKLQSECNKLVFFAYDFVQTLSVAEKKRNIPQRLLEISGFYEQKLSDKIRTNKSMVSFIRNMMNLTCVPRHKMDYSNIDIIYAPNVDSAKSIIRSYDNDDYTFINYTQSRFYSNSIDEFGARLNTHHVIGQEYDKVVIFMDLNFQYGEDGHLQAKVHPNPDYYFYKLLYQALSRCRKKLCIVVIDNYMLFEKLIGIKSSGYNKADSLAFRE